MLDLHNSIKVSNALNTTTVSDNTAIVGTIIDTNGFETLEVAIAAGSLVDADATFAVTVQESAAANMAGSNAVAATDLLGTLAGASFTFADDNVVKKLGYRGTKRYIQITITPSANTSAATFTAVALQTKARQGPVA